MKRWLVFWAARDFKLRIEGVGFTRREPVPTVGLDKIYRDIGVYNGIFDLAVENKSRGNKSMSVVGIMAVLLESLTIMLDDVRTVVNKQLADRGEQSSCGPCHNSVSRLSNQPTTTPIIMHSTKFYAELSRLAYLSVISSILMRQ